MAIEPSVTKLSINLKDNLEKLRQLLGDPSDLVTEVHGLEHTAGIAFLSSLSDSNDIQSNLLPRLIQLLAEPDCSIDQLAVLLPKTNPHRISDLEAAAADLFEGRTVILLNSDSDALSFATPGWAKHDVKEPVAERVIRGPREGFTETLEENLGMIRRWVKDVHLRVDTLMIGRRSQTRVAVVYLVDIAQPRLVREVHSRLTAIDIDAVIESGYIEQLIKDRRASIFPLTQNTERTDKVAAAVYEGRVAILVDKSPSAIIAPVTVNELYQSTEDYYFDFWLGSFLRLIRLLGNNLAVALPALYVALVAVNPEQLPTQFYLMIASSRERIPIPIIIEVLVLDLMVEIFREAGLRLPGTVGETLGVVSGVVIGLIGVFGGFVSPATMIVVSLTAIASFTGPNYAVGITWRLLKYFLLFAAAMFGLFGLTAAGFLILIHAADVKSFGVSFLAPWSPLEWRELADGPVRAPFWFRLLRPKTYRPQDRLRSGGTKKED